MKTTRIFAATAAGLLLAACSDGTTAPLAPVPGATGLRADGPGNNPAVTGAAFTTINSGYDKIGGVAIPDATLCANGSPNINCNIYGDKDYVWLNGGPSVAYVGDGEYFFAVLKPGGQADPNDGTPNNLSDLSPTSGTGAGDAYTNRMFTVRGGKVSYSGTHTSDNNKIRLMGYDDTPNPGGVYILAICSLEKGYPVKPSRCKYDAFKVKQSDGGAPVAGIPAVLKDANPAYTNTFTWGIGKEVDRTKVTLASGNATFTYKVTLTHDGGTISGVKVAGTITASNPNLSALQARITDELTSEATTPDFTPVNCTIDGTGAGGAVTLVPGNSSFDYTCSLSSLPSGTAQNVVTLSWDGQDVDVLKSDGTTARVTLAGNSTNWAVSGIDFAGAGKLIDSKVTLTDAFNGLGQLAIGSLSGVTITTTDNVAVTTGIATTGTPAVTTIDATAAPSPLYFGYSRSIPVTANKCVGYNNTATYTSTTSSTTGSGNASVTVCSTMKGGLTMGFWQNKNGQGIISGGTAAASGVCNSATWLRLYAPFADLAPTSTCPQVATYVFNVIKAANAGGATMNAMLKSQMLATALDVYFSDAGLGGTKIKAFNGGHDNIGSILVDLTQVCKMLAGSGGGSTCSGTYQNASAAFGGSTQLTVSAMLSYAASQSNTGGVIWYAQNKMTQGLAKDAFDAINNSVVTVAVP